MSTSGKRSQTMLAAAGFFGVAGVALGAFGAHGLAERLAAAGTVHTWETAARYHVLHALALLVIGVWLRGASGSVARRAAWSGRFWIVGTILFSGSLYGLALGGPRLLGPVTPLGGIALMIGWAFVIAAAFGDED